MNDDFPALIRRLKILEEKIETRMAQHRAAYHVSVENGKVAFKRTIEQRHREFKVHLLRYVLGARPLIILTAPLIYVMIVPFLVLDLCATLYQAVCFPVYGVQKVRRADYLIFDRAQLGYLNALEKINCAYCSYANGLIAYVREIAGRTEQYWCPIKHAQRVRSMHEHYYNFVDFGDANGYREKLEALRKRLKQDRES